MDHTNEPPAHAWLRPRVEALIRDAIAAGIPRDIAVAVMLDVAGAAGVNPVALPAEPPTPEVEAPRLDPENLDALTPDLSGAMPPMIGRFRESG